MIIKSACSGVWKLYDEQTNKFRWCSDQITKCQKEGRKVYRLDYSILGNYKKEYFTSLEEAKNRLLQVSNS